jgi:DNA polymerase
MPYPVLTPARPLFVAEKSRFFVSSPRKTERSFMKRSANKETLEELRKQVADCTRCPLHKERNNAVFGEGRWDAPIMIIGEGPGAREDQLGRPFVGRAGKLLDQLLAPQGLSRTDNVFIANIVKCRPPHNRVPHKVEIATCFSYLTQQINMVDPRIIVLLGATAVKAYYGELRQNMGEIRGQWSGQEGRLVMPTYHPAAVFRNRTYQRYIEADLKTIADRYRRLNGRSGK